MRPPGTGNHAMERGTQHGPSNTKTGALPPVKSEAAFAGASHTPFRAKLVRYKWAIIAMALTLIAALVTGLAVGLTRAQGAGDSPALIGTAMGLAAPVPAWRIQSTAQVGNDLSVLSKSGVDVSSWYQVNLSKCTLMACLIQAGVYNDTDLFFSDNLKKVDSSRFAVPWVYRQDFSLRSSAVASGSGNHFFLETHGITSKGDIWFNGQQLADKTEHAGSYVGKRFDVTNLISTNNVLAVRVYPTNYNYDFALGFVDWNPYPADNGTGVWRDVMVHQTQGASMTDYRLVTSMDSPSGQATANVTLKATVTNLDNQRATIDVQGSVLSMPNSSAGSYQNKNQQSLDLGPLESREVSLTIPIENAQIWWPKLWGAQPLYSARLSLSVNGVLSDSNKRTFGIRTVTSQVNKYNDTIFSINGQPFQVVGGGYSADMFLRWDPARFEAQARYMLDLGHNTVRLEGKQEHPELYEIADRLGLMVMAGWECCDKWEAWKYNEDLAIQPPPVYSNADYEIAAASMRHEAMMMQSHPSMLTFLVGSDYWPDDRATKVYVDAFKAADWQMPIISSASKRGYPKLLGPSGMKMDGPYDWVPPNYWYDTDDSSSRKGAAFGFGSELGAGVGTPEIGSLRKFLSQSDMDDLWKEPKKGLFHMSNEGSQFFTREIYNEALVKRQGGGSGTSSPMADSLDDYLLKAQMMDYEATRAEFEGFAARWNADRPATGLIYWMLNNAWPSLHWNLFDYYLHPAGSYFGAKVGARQEHVAYDYVKGAVYLINKSLDKRGTRNVDVQVMSLDGKLISSATAKVDTEPNESKPVTQLSNAVRDIKDVVLVRLRLSDDKNATLSRNVYWLANGTDELNWGSSTWYHTPVTRYADFTALNKMGKADLTVSTKVMYNTNNARTVVLENKGSVPAVFVRLNLVDDKGADVNPVIWSDNYVTLWPGETLELDVTEGVDKGASIEVSGKNVASTTVAFS